MRYLILTACLLLQQVVVAYSTDTLPPRPDSVWVISERQLGLRFHEAVDPISAEEPRHYRVDPLGLTPTYATHNRMQPREVELMFADSFPVRQLLQLQISGVRDTSGQRQDGASLPFWRSRLRYGDLLIHELMADPSPVVGLPDAEWLEIRNAGPLPIELGGWRLARASLRSGPLPSRVLLPDSCLVLCGSSAWNSLSAISDAVAVTSFPVLTNDGDCLSLLAPDGTRIHAVCYAGDWYENVMKAEGGWSIEMKDPRNPCGGRENWSASTDPSGGTPGRSNSISRPVPDDMPPLLLRAFAEDSLHLTVYFSEATDSQMVVNPLFYEIDGGIGRPVSVMAQPPQYRSAVLTLPQALRRQTVYTLSLSGGTDCVGNTITRSQCPFGLREPIDTLDIVVNEVLFNPRGEGADYVEVLNRSRDILNLGELYIAHRNTAGELADIRPFSEEDRLIFPGEHYVVTGNPLSVMNQYVVSEKSHLIAIENLPTFSDEEGEVILLNGSGEIIDEVAYRDDWHFALLADREGVSLERLRAEGPSSDPENWHSASATSGFGTPTGPNSQVRDHSTSSQVLWAYPPVLSPDNDGTDDFLTLEYRLEEPGYFAHIDVFDIQGRWVRVLAHAALCGTQGRFRWDGLTATGRRPPPGLYILCTTFQHPRGYTKKIKTPVVIR